MEEYIQAKATVRVYGNADYEAIKGAAERFIKEVYKYKRAKLKASEVRA